MRGAGRNRRWRAGERSWSSNDCVAGLTRVRSTRILIGPAPRARVAAMDTDVRALTAVAKTYFDAAYEMDAAAFASIFHHTCSVTKLGVDGVVSVTPIETWLAGVRSMQ